MWLAPCRARTRQAKPWPDWEGQGEGLLWLSGSQGHIWVEMGGRLMVICGWTIPWLTCGQEAIVQKEMSGQDGSLGK